MCVDFSQTEDPHSIVIPVDAPQFQLLITSLKGGLLQGLANPWKFSTRCAAGTSLGNGLSPGWTVGGCYYQWAPLWSCCSLSDTSFPLHIIRQKNLEMQHFSINHLCLVIIVETFRSTFYLVLSLVWWTYPIGQFVMIEVLRLNPRFRENPHGLWENHEEMMNKASKTVAVDLKVPTWQLILLISWETIWGWVLIV